MRYSVSPTGSASGPNASSRRRSASCRVASDCSCCRRLALRDAHVVHRLCDARIFRRQDLPAQRERILGQLQRAVVHAQARVGARHADHQARGDEGLLDAQAFDAPRAGLENLPRGDVGPREARIRILEQPDAGMPTPLRPSRSRVRADLFRGRAAEYRRSRARRSRGRRRARSPRPTRGVAETFQCDSAVCLHARRSDDVRGDSRCRLRAGARSRSDAPAPCASQSGR